MTPLSAATTGGLIATLTLGAAALAAEPVENYGQIEQPGENLLTAPAFSDLDQDGSGYLTKDEARGRPGLLQSWKQADTDADDRIDRAEFAAFEVAVTSARPTQAAPSPDPASGEGLAHDRSNADR